MQAFRLARVSVARTRSSGPEQPPLAITTSPSLGRSPTVRAISALNLRGRGRPSPQITRASSPRSAEVVKEEDSDEIMIDCSPTRAVQRRRLQSLRGDSPSRRSAPSRRGETSRSASIWANELDGPSSRLSPRESRLEEIAEEEAAVQAEIDDSAEPEPEQEIRSVNAQDSDCQQSESSHDSAGEHVDAEAVASVDEELADLQAGESVTTAESAEDSGSFLDDRDDPALYTTPQEEERRS